MSRQYPVHVGRCEPCQVNLMATSNGQVRPHTCWVPWNGSPRPAWASMTAIEAAKLLGVSQTYLTGLGNHSSGCLRMVKLVREQDVGQPDARSRYVYNRDDVLALAKRLGK